MHYLRMALRHLLKRPLFSGLNLLGLTISMAGALLIGQYVYSELKTDEFIADQDRTFRLLRTSDINNEPYNVGVTSAPFKDALLTDFPHEIAEATRVRFFNEPILRVNNTFYSEEQVFSVDSNFVDFFGLELLQGQSAQVFNQPRLAVITPEAAERFFGPTVNPIGETFQIGTSDPFTITGIIAPPPANSHLEYDVLVSIISYTDSNWWSEWWWNSLGTYLKLQPGIAAADLEPHLPGFMDKYFGDDFEVNGNRIDLKLEPVAETYFAADTRYDFVRHGNYRMIQVFAIVALLLLGIGCANYINLTTARTAERAQTISVMRTLGANRKQVRWQLLLEGGALAVLSTIGAVLLSQALIQPFSTYFDFEIPVALSAGSWMVAALAGCLLIILLGAWFPASYLSRLEVQRGLQADQRSTGTLRRVLVTGQFVLSIALICATLLIRDQLDFLQEKPLGFQAEDILSAPAYNNDVYDQRVRLADWLRDQDAIRSVSYASGLPGGFYDATTLDIEGMDRNVRMRTLLTTGEYLSALDISFVAGRNFDPLRASDSTEAAIINERGALELGLTPADALGRSLTLTMFDSIPKRIIGVVQDYHFTSLHATIEPLIITQDDWPGMLTIEAEAGRGEDAFLALRQAWDRFSPNYPLIYSFLDDELQALYSEDQRTGRLLSFFAYVAVFVSCLGIFGLSAFAAARRMREISIRKILGASGRQLLGLLLKDFTLPLAFAFIIAIPLAWLFMSRWLDTFAYHTNISWTVFALAGGAAILLAILTVSYQSLRAILLNPADHLRKE
ncbi:MAG: FtsX-like permease family protein [Bacteroidota bacterium]